MTKEMNHKGYKGSIEYSEEDNVFHGKIENIDDLVTYESENKEELESCFKEAVEDYIKTCEDLDKGVSE